MRGNNYFMLVCFSILLVLMAASVSAELYEANYSTDSSATLGPNLVVQILKYEPYPVNTGDWFDLWVKVQNIGQQDANSARFELAPEYPFSSNDSLVRDYGLIYGKISSFRIDQTYDSSQIILKYRVKVADNAPSGTSNLKLRVTLNKLVEGGITYYLPVIIGKTKTDFDVIMQDSTTSGTSFSIVNIGDNDATAVKVSIPQQSGVRVTGPSASILGNLAKGDFTTLSFQVTPNRNVENITMQIDYTDTAGIRSSVVKIVPVNLIVSGNLTSTQFRVRTGTATTTSATSSRYFYIILGVILGVVAILVYNRIKRKQ